MKQSLFALVLAVILAFSGVSADKPLLRSQELAFMEDVQGHRQLRECSNVCPFSVSEPRCPGFSYASRQWDAYAQIGDNGEILQQACRQQCCYSQSEDECCDDYPTGYYVGFGLGLVGLIIMTLACCYECGGFNRFTSKKEEA